MRQRWLNLKLEQKVRWIAVCAAVVVLLSVAANVLVTGFGMRGFGSILGNNSKSLAFWSAMEQESAAFERYVMDRSEEKWNRYEEACARTREELAELPFDYREIGAGRYARTWSIRNLYENYVVVRDQAVAMKRSQRGYLDRLSLVYRLQDYLSSYAGSLEQMTIEMGSRQYEEKQYLLVVVPAVSLLCGIGALCLVGLLERSVRRNIVQPVLELAEDSDRIAAGDYGGPDVQAEGDDEIGSLVRAFCNMKGATRSYIETLKEKHAMERKMDDMRLQMLKNQINPHFLFNTLNMIASTAQIEDAATTEKMIEALSRLFRYNLKSSDSVMPLERELKVVQDYMYLQQMRFGKRIRYFADCEEDTLQVLIPSFILQPLVENAIKHGLSASSQGGKIVVRTWIHDSRLWISVADTGSGMSAERLEEVRQALETDDDRKVGIGVRNIYRRVLTMYQDGEMYVDSIEGCGTAVQIVFSPERYREV